MILFPFCLDNPGIPIQLFGSPKDLFYYTPVGLTVDGLIQGWMILPVLDDHDVGCDALKGSLGVDHGMRTGNAPAVRNAPVNHEKSSLLIL